MREQLMNKLAELEERRFYLNMKDRWSADDYNFSAKLFTEIQLVKAELEKLNQTERKEEEK